MEQLSVFDTIMNFHWVFLAIVRSPSASVVVEQMVGVCHRSFTCKTRNKTTIISLKAALPTHRRRFQNTMNGLGNLSLCGGDGDVRSRGVSFPLLWSARNPMLSQLQSNVLTLFTCFLAGER